ncbi:hypothetical protein B566_EDAN001498 [Ephemera danica]|nr:hypothetical protein B566_EDAN001498 [Ephemera danica]
MEEIYAPNARLSNFKCLPSVSPQVVFSAMCNTEYAAAMALSAAAAAQVSVAAPTNNRLFRPWDAAVSAAQVAAASKTCNTEQQETCNSLQRKRNKLQSSRRDTVKVNIKTEDIPTTDANQQQIVQVGASVPPCPSLATTDVTSHVELASMTADALYAELSRSDLARLGLVCPADLARLRARKQRPKKYHCPHCHVAFSNNGQLRGERPFACQHVGCGKAFTRNEELTRHRRIHSGIRPYPCAACGKRFGRKDHLKKHARTHQKLSQVHHHATSSSSAAAAVHAAAAAAAFNAAATLFPLDPAAILPSLVPYPYPGVFGF